MLEDRSYPSQDRPRQGIGRAMHSDIDLTRKIMEAVRDRQSLWPRTVEIPGYDPIVVARHVERLHDSKLIEGPRVHVLSEPVATIKVRDLTPDGHEFLSALESGDVWERIKTALNPTELGALSFQELAGIAKELAVRGIKRKLGLD